MTAKGTCRGSGIGFGAFSRGIIKVGGIWVSPVYMADATCSNRVLQSPSGGIEYHRGNLRKSNNPSSSRPETAHSLFFSSPYGFSDLKFI